MSAGAAVNIEFDRERVLELAAAQIDNYQRQPEELISHFNREVSALDGYRGRQLLELIQNADDAGVDADAGCSLLLHLSRDRLIVANTGKHFSSKGLTSLVISDCSPKQLDRNRFIGCKGLGFRSILTWTDGPLISSGPYEVIFDRASAEAKVRQLAANQIAINEIVEPFKESTGRWPAAVMRFPDVPRNDNSWLQEARECRAKGYNTVVVLPLPDDKRGNDIHQEMIEQISGLPTSSLLFCRHLTRVEITGDLQKTWDLLRENHSDDHATVILQQDGSPELWHVYRRTGQVSSETASTSSGDRRDYEVAVAVPEIARPNPTGALCVFFPTHERLPCSLVMHATLETTDDRNRLVDHALNREVLRHLAAHVAGTIEEQATPTTSRRALELLAGVENADHELRALGFVDALIEECAGRLIFPRLDGTLNSSDKVYQVPHSTWLLQLGRDLFPEVLAIRPTDALSTLLKLFKLSWFDSTTLKERLRRYLLSVDRDKAGEIVGHLLADRQLSDVGAGGLLVGEDGMLIDDGDCFFTPVEKLPILPTWASNIRFVDEEFQSGLLRGSKMTGLRFLALDLSRCDGKVDEYRFDTVARALIDQVEAGSEADAPAHVQRWQELLRWLFDASRGARQILPQLSIKVVTGRGTLRRATTCYLGPDYPRGQIVWRLYKQFHQDEFVGSTADCGLDDLAAGDVEEFLIAIGVNSSPRLEALRSGSDYQRFVRTVVERIDYPRTIRDRLCKNVDELHKLCTSFAINGLRLPDRWLKILTDGDAAAVVAFLISSGGSYLTEERDSQATFQATVESERTYRDDISVPIPNPMLFFLREIAWVPAPDGPRRRPSEIMLSNQGVRVLRGVFSRHALNPKDKLIDAHGGRQAVESLLTRLGAVSSLENLNGQSLYELLLALPERDPSGEVAPGIYRTLIESSITADESPHRERFLKAGRMWGGHKSVTSYLPVNELRYNANLAVTKAIETHIPLVDIPRRKSTQMVKQLFGISSLTSEEIVLTLESEGTEYDPASEDANRHFRIAMPYIYALRLGRTLDERGRELGLLRKAALRVCTQARVSARLPGDVTEIIILTKPGERIVVDTSLVVVGDYRENGPGFLTFWLSAAELVAELLGTDVAYEVGGILRCRTPAEMLEVVQVGLGSDADRKLSEATTRFDSTSMDGNDEADYPIPSPKPTDEASPAPQPAQLSPPTTSAGSPDSGATGRSVLTSDTRGTFQPIDGPSERLPKRRKLVVTGAGGGGGGGAGPLATEDVTFKVVAAFEKHEGRFIIPVSHLHGSDGFGCDLLSVASETLRDKVLTEKSINDADVERYIEVKGRSSRTGEVELSDNEYRAAQRCRERYWLYRVFVDPLRASHYEVAVLSDPLNSNAVRTVIRFNLAQGSGASWYSMAETVEEEPSVSDSTDKLAE